MMEKNKLELTSKFTSKLIGLHQATVETKLLIMLMILINGDDCSTKQNKTKVSLKVGLLYHLGYTF